MMRVVRKHTDCKWLLLYIERWLKAPTQVDDGTLIGRDKGTPQGGVISPLLSNLFLHYTFDEWMRRNYPSIPFERYADDIIVHCRSEKQARWIRSKVEKRLLQCKLELHPEKTEIVYCKNENRQGNYPNERCDFLGYTFRPRKAKSREGKYFIGFIPAVSDKAAKRMRQVMRSWRFHRRSDLSIEDLSRFSNPILRGWINYYGQYYKSELYCTFEVLNRILIRWAMRKYKKLKGHRRRAAHWLGRIACRHPQLFAHWQVGFRPSAGR
jgi:RNA-directed DNA polymerase